MARVARLGVVIESAGAKKGAAETNAALDSMGAAAKRSADVRAKAERDAAAATGNSTKSLDDQVRAMRRTEQAANKAANDARRAIQFQSEYAAAQRAAAAAESVRAAKAVESAERQVRAMALLEIEAYKLDAAMNSTGKAAGAADGAFNRVRGSLTGLLAPILGTVGGANALASTLGSLAIGNALTVAVLAGVAAIGAAYTILTEKARKLKEEQEKANTALRDRAKAEQEGTGGQLSSQLKNAEASLAGKRKELERLSAVADRSVGGSGLGEIAGNLAAREIAKRRSEAQRKEYAQLVADIETGEAALRKVYAEANRQASSDRSAELAALVAANKATLKEKQQAAARLKNLEDSLRSNVSAGGDPAERLRLIADIKALNDALNPSNAKANAAALREVKAEAKELARELKMALRLIEDENERIGKTLAIDVAKKEKTAAALAEVVAKRTEATKAADEAISAQQDELDLIGKTLVQRKALVDMARYFAAIEKGYSDQQAEQYVRNQRALDDSKAKTESFSSSLRTLDGVLQQLGTTFNQSNSDAVRSLAAVSAAIQTVMAAKKQADEAAKKARDAGTPVAGGNAIVGGIGVASAGFGAGYGVGSQTTSKTLGALGGAAAGAAAGAVVGSVVPIIGTAIGAIVGGVAGMVGGLLGSANKGKQAAAQMAIAQEQLGKSLDAMRATFAGDTLGASIAAARAQFDELRKATEAAYSGKKNETERNKILLELNALEAQRVQILKDQYAAELALATADLSARLLRARGATEEADKINQASAATRELNAAIEKYGKDSSYVEALREVQAAEATAADAIRARVALEKQRQQAEYGANLTAREQALAGNDRGAFVTRQGIDSTRALNEAADMVAAGTITADMFERLKVVIGSEMVDALEAFDAAVAAALQAQQDDLAVRALLATGNEAGAAALRREIANRNELAGVTDAALIAQITYVQGLEAIAIAQAAAAAEAQRIAEINAGIDRRMIDALRTIDPLKAAELEKIRKEIERAQEIAKAGDAVTAARLAELFALEDQAAAMNAATAAIQAQVDAAQRLADFNASVEVDYLRATGRNFEADKLLIEEERTRRLKENAQLGGDAEGVRKINAIFDDKLNKLIASTIENAAPAVGASGVSADVELVTRSVARSISSVEAIRLLDVATSSLAVLQRIATNTEGGSGGGVRIQVTVQGGAYAGTPADVGRGIAEALAPMFDDALGRRVGVARRLTGSDSL